MIIEISKDPAVAREREADAGPAHYMVRLDCNGELVNFRSVGLAGPRESRLGAVVRVKFVCPRCDGLHQSHWFRCTA